MVRDELELRYKLVARVEELVSWLWDDAVAEGKLDEVMLLTVVEETIVLELVIEESNVFEDEAVIRVLELTDVGIALELDIAVNESEEWVVLERLAE